MNRCLLALLPLVPATCFAQTAGLVAYWPFDDWSGATAHEQFGHNANCTGNPQWLPGRIGGAIRFLDGTPPMVVNDTPALRVTDGLTISAWVSGGMAGYFFSMHAVAYKESSYYFGVSDAHVYGRVYSNGWKAVRGATRLADNRWYHIAMTYDRTDGGVPTTDLLACNGVRRLPGGPACPESSAAASPVGALPAGWDTNHREIGNVLYEPSDPNPDLRYKAWYTGYQGDTYIQNQVYVGWYTSPDGVHWTNRGQISNLSLEDPYVVRNDGIYYLFAENKDEWNPNRVVGNIKRLHSTDLVHWVDDGNVLSAQTGGTPNNWQSQDVASPIVWVEAGHWYMLYEARGSGNAGAIGLAHSTDGFLWTKETSPVLFPTGDGTWDSSSIVPDDLVKVGNTYYVYYHANGPLQIGTWMGVATSADLHNWTRSPQNPFDQHATLMILNENGRFTFFGEDDGSGINRYQPVMVSAPRVFIDGVEEKYWERADTNNGPIATANSRMTIGNSPSGPAYPFYGLIDELRIYNRALDAGEIGQLAAARAPTITGDSNCDGRVDNFDIDAFVMSIVDARTFAAFYSNCPALNGDVNHDGRTDNFDISPFVDCLILGNCP